MTSPKQSPEPEAIVFAADGGVPNNPRLPLLLYRGVLSLEGDAAKACLDRFAGHGWTAGWRNGIFSYHHFHTRSHEVLGIVRGEARVRFGGPGGRTVAVSAGDVVVVPAGVGHKNEGGSADLLVVGAYADGREPDLCRGDEAAKPGHITAIAAVPLPGADPVAGSGGR
ncbi:MAG: cupin domain-containing protein [Dongiaceae bacterium]